MEAHVLVAVRRRLRVIVALCRACQAPLQIAMFSVWASDVATQYSLVNVPRAHIVLDKF